MGFTHAHLWVAPPELGTEYVFHSRPADKAHVAPMGASVLATWYEKMLSRAQQKGIVKRVDTLARHVEGLTSVRDFPLFDGDFFPDALPDVIERGKAMPPPPPPAKKKGKGIVSLARSETLMIADEMRNTVSNSQYRFLVATLNAAAHPVQVGREKQITSHELIDDSVQTTRSDFISYLFTVIA